MHTKTFLKHTYKDDTIYIQLYIGMNLDEKWGSNPYPFSGIASQKAESEERAQA